MATYLDALNVFLRLVDLFLHGIDGFFVQEGDEVQEFALVQLEIELTFK